ncbi:hypothetical protein NQZ79_g4293 [Umbelopsis isabellina]|nr:hypothetical protein NQZ79_g4293 [Umbelopsis isabellina]
MCSHGSSIDQAAQSSRLALAYEEGVMSDAPKLALAAAFPLAYVDGPMLRNWTGPTLRRTLRIPRHESLLNLSIRPLLLRSDPATQTMMKQELQSTLTARYRLPPEVIIRVQSPLPNDIVLDYLNGKFEPYKHGRFIDVSDPAAGFPTAR